MKKKLLALISVFTCAVICISGCGLGNYLESGNNKKPDDTQITKPPEGENPEVKDENYKLSVYVGTERYRPGDREIMAVWRNDTDVYRVPLDENGTANAGKLDGDYLVYIEGLPDEYAYDSNGCFATAEDKSVSITLVEFNSAVSGTGESLYINDGCYLVRHEGFYRATVKNEWTKVYYQYTPENAGFYSVESTVAVYADDVNPIIDVYNGSTGFKMYNRTIDGGGYTLDGGYTKNFRYEVRVDRKEVGNSFTFAVGAQSKDKSYPVNVDFRIKYEGEYVSGNSDVRVQRAAENKVKAAEPNRNEKFVFADEDTKIFDMRKYKYNPDTNWYHRYDERLYNDSGYGKGYGPVLCCAIDKAIPSYPLTKLIDAHEVGKAAGFSFNYLKLYNIWLEDEQKFVVYDYTNFIREDYYRVCNRDGVCYVTPELKQFLQVFAENHSLYTDGVGAGEGTPEACGYNANQDALWLFACGYYK